MTLDDILAESIPSIEQVRAWIEAMDIPDTERARLLAEMELRHEMQTEMHKLAERVKAGEIITYADIAAATDRIAEKRGFYGGIPMPQLKDDGTQPHRLMLAARGPISLGEALQRAIPTEAAQQLERWQRHVINSWDVPGDHTVSIIKTTEGPMWVKTPMAGNRLRKILADVEIRSDVSTMTAEAELAALESLKGRVKKNQYRTYVLSGSFVEKSKRSGLFYFFRKGRPTLACSFHKGDEGHVLAALCLHPHGYYEFSHVGVMTPTDEVIAALLMMRGDEHKFWAKSGQWQAADPRSGI